MAYTLNIREQRLKENCKCNKHEDSKAKCGCHTSVLEKKETKATKARSFLFNNLKR
jgi:hypothetical protein